MTSATIRQAELTDAPLILEFVVELAKFVNAESEVSATVADIEATVFNDEYNTNAIICELDGKPIGFAVYFFNYSTWQGKHGLYLEDLYISPEHRGIGAGIGMLKHLANIALSKSCGRFEWSAIDTNVTAIEFYKSLGAVSKDEWIGFRMSGDVLTKFAE